MFIRSLFAAAVLPLAFASAAQAQALGNYRGTQANGAYISMTLSKDMKTGLPEITDMSLEIKGTCKPSGTVDTGWGVGLQVDVKNNKASFTFGAGYPYLYVTASMTFSGNSVAGTITSYTPVFTPVAIGHPTAAQFCTAAQQSFKMTYSGANALPDLPAGFTFIAGPARAP